MSNDLKQSAENFILSEVSPSSPDWRTTVEWMVDFAENQLANERERREVAESEALKYKTAGDYPLNKVEETEYYTIPFERFGWWFRPVRDSSMERVNLPVFYFFGDTLRNVKDLFRPPIPENHVQRAKLILVESYLQTFLADTKNIALPLTRKATEKLQASLLHLGEKLSVAPVLDKNEDFNRQVSSDHAFVQVKHCISEFEQILRHESSRVSVFTVTPKGIYDIEALIERAEDRFSAEVLVRLSETTIYDLKEAGKCLAFDCPTAMAFHICRALEAVVLTYYEALAGHEWTNPRNKFKDERNLGKYILELQNLGAPVTITHRLDEIRKYDRNPISHPETIVEIKMARPMFDLISAVIPFMTEEIEKLKSSSDSSPSASLETAV